MTSPRPWRVRSRLGDGCIVDRNGFGVANEVSIMDAKSIVQAVNAFDDVVAALQATLAALQIGHTCEERRRALDLAAAALAKAGAK